MNTVRVNCARPLYASLWALVGRETRGEVEAFRKALGRKEAEARRAGHSFQRRRRPVRFDHNGIKLMD